MEMEVEVEMEINGDGDGDPMALPSCAEQFSSQAKSRNYEELNSIWKLTVDFPTPVDQEIFFQETLKMSNHQTFLHQQVF